MNTLHALNNVCKLPTFSICIGDTRSAKVTGKLVFSIQCFLIYYIFISKETHFGKFKKFQKFYKIEELEYIEATTYMVRVSGIYNSYGIGFPNAALIYCHLMPNSLNLEIDFMNLISKFPIPSRRDIQKFVSENDMHIFDGKYGQMKVLLVFLLLLASISLLRCAYCAINLDDRGTMDFH
ncbi:unnamed protein product [Wuchereria bancrofti]|uniref:Uncharacterized protein n=1 Tax=Wuchereria bancrofti TaxID=6293 RepID=A0A3P7ERS1_WUCBA|nr:unnamed protein product [Wuchereria bancrofti]